jgi:hypothetical protein
MKCQTINIAPPICLCGFTADGRMVLGGAFQAGDTMGIPLWFLMDEAAEHGAVISIPHYFASAIEHGWDDDQTFRKIRENMVDSSGHVDMETIKEKCIAMFMAVAGSMQACVETQEATRAMQIAKQMRMNLEADKLAHHVADRIEVRK